MPEYQDLVNIQKIANNIGAIDWHKAAREIWDHIGWHNEKTGIATNENWMKYATTVSHAATKELNNFYRNSASVTGIGNVIAYFTLIKQLGNNYHHPAFDYLV